MQLCSVEGCEKERYCTVFCQYHYNKQYQEMRAANPDYVLTTGKCLRWIDEHVDYSGDDCLMWPYARTRAGYPNMKYKGSYAVASRVMCIKAHGEPPSDDMHAAHSCGNGAKGCMNPNHLSWKSPMDNEKDKLAHGTRYRGEDCTFSKLTWQMVDGIRRDRVTMTGRAVAKKYGIAPQTVSKIWRNKTWVRDAA